MATSRRRKVLYMEDLGVDLEALAEKLATILWKEGRNFSSPPSLVLQDFPDKDCHDLYKPLREIRIKQAKTVLNRLLEAKEV